MHRREFLKLLGKGAALGICAVEMARRAHEAPEELDMRIAWYASLSWSCVTEQSATVELTPDVGTAHEGSYKRFTMIGGENA